MNAAVPPGLSIRHLDFGFGDTALFRDFSLELGSAAFDDNPAVILGPSGCGKTTLLRLMAGLLKPGAAGSLSVSFMFQEPRLLPWKTALENVILPLKKLMGKAEAADRARRFLSLVGLSDRAGAYPRELSGGQCQRISMARAFAYPSDLILMDEPFQSLDIPLRKQLMELSLSLLAGSPRRMAAVTHEPREAVFLGRRIIVLGEPPRGIVFDERLNLSPEDRRYGSEAWIRMEARLLSVLTGAQSRETIGGS